MKVLLQALLSSWQSILRRALLVNESKWFPQRKKQLAEEQK